MPLSSVAKKKSARKNLPSDVKEGRTVFIRCVIVLNTEPCSVRQCLPQSHTPYWFDLIQWTFLYLFFLPVAVLGYLTPALKMTSTCVLVLFLVVLIEFISFEGTCLSTQRRRNWRKFSCSLENLTTSRLWSIQKRNIQKVSQSQQSKTCLI